MKIDESMLRLIVSDCGKFGGRGGFGCYYWLGLEFLTVLTLITDNNGWTYAGVHLLDGAHSCILLLRSVLVVIPLYGIETGDKLGDQSKFATGSTVMLNNNGKAGLLVYTSSTANPANATVEICG